VTVSRRWLQAPFVGQPAEVDEPFVADFVAVFKAHFAYVWHSLRRLGVREGDLEDVVHDVFVTVHRRLDAYDPARPMRPWLFAFACRAAADYRKQARHRVALIDDPGELRDPAPAVDEQAITLQELDRVARALDALELDRRAVFVLHEIDGFPVPEVARALGIPANTAYSRLRLARADFEGAIRRLDLQRSLERGRR
jgi:RNA polymerase sigma-70 factor (ECF subfamily)